MKKQNLVVSFSGGRTSAMMAYHIFNSAEYRSKYELLFIFANTGKEREETLQFVHDCDVKWGLGTVWVESCVTLKHGVGLEALTTNFARASRKGEPFEAVIEKLNHTRSSGVPCITAPYCSENLKRIPIDKYAVEYFGSKDFVTALGYRAEDMPRRVTIAALKASPNRIAPMITDFVLPLNQKDVLKFWSEQPFDLAIHSKYSNCDLCYKKANSKKVEILRLYPEIAEWWIKQETRWGGAFHYDVTTTAELLRLSKLPKTQQNLFAETENMAGFEEGCGCGIG